MVMGPTHAMSGAAAWLVAAPAVSAAAGHTLTVPEVALGAAVCAGSALLPDWDMPGTTVSGSHGPLSEGIAHVVGALSLAIYNATKTSRDDHRNNGHRTFTHTILAAVLAGFAVSTLGATLGKPFTVGVLFFTFGLAIRGLMNEFAKKEGWLVVTGLSAAGAWVAYENLPAGSFWWLGFAVTAGMILHDLGDMVTMEGAVLTAPLVHRHGKAWWEWAPPSFLRFRAGKKFEYGILLPALTAVTVLASIKLWDPVLFTSLTGLAA